MKAKEIADTLLRDCELMTSDEQRLTEEVFKAFYVIRDEIITTVTKRKNVDSQIGVYREGLTKWKSVVRQVNEANSNIPIFDNMFGIYFAIQAPNIFEILINRNVFLGYVMSEAEQQLINELKMQSAIAEFDKQVQRKFFDFMMGRSL